MTDQDDELIARLEQRGERRNERREFFRTALGAAAVTAVGAGALAIGSGALAQTATTDTDLLNFALNLEYLEAQFYSFAATGVGLPANLLTGISTGTTAATPGAVTGGRQVAFTDPVVAQYAREIAADEVAHVTFLRGVLGTLAVAQPAIDIGSSATSAFSVAAQAAKVVPAGTAFDPYASDENFLLAAFLFEDVGVSAYRGAASLISDRTTYLEAAAGLLAAEAYHASLIRTTLYAKGVATPALRSNADLISNARDLLDGATFDSDQGISPVTLNATNSPIVAQLIPALTGQTASNIVPTTAEGLVVPRNASPSGTVGGVLNIVYLNSAAVTKGGFFPSGVNGSLATSTAN